MKNFILFKTKKVLLFGGITILLLAAVLYPQRQTMLCFGSSINATKMVRLALLLNANPDSPCWSPIEDVKSYFQYLWEQRNHPPFLTPLTIAAQKKYTGAIAVLLEKGADPNGLDKAGNVPVIEAIKSESKEVLAAILAASPNLKQSCVNGLSPIHHWASTSKPDSATLHYLVAKGADVNQADRQGNTPLHLASEKGDAKSLALLMAHKANQLQQNVEGQIALYKASTEEAAEVLLSGMDENTLIKDDNLLGSAVTTGVGTIALMAIISHSPDLVNRPNRKGITPLMKAAKKGRADVFQKLLSKGASVTATTRNGTSVYAIAQRSGNASIIAATETKLLKTNPSMKRTIASNQRSRAKALARSSNKAASRGGAGVAARKGGGKALGKVLTRGIPIVGAALLLGDIISFFGH